MSLFKRKAVAEGVVHCPVCGERVPEGAVDCAMCGHAFQAPPGDREAAAARQTGVISTDGT